MDVNKEVRDKAIAGALAGCAVRSVLFPVDTVKTHMQTKGTPLAATLRSFGGLSAPQAVRMLYRGITPALLEIGVNRGALMGLSAGVKRMLPDELPEVGRDAAAGAAAGCLKTAVLHPLDTLTCRGQLGVSWTAQLWPPQLTLYNGLGTAVCRSAGGMAIWLSVRNGLERSSEEAPEALRRRPWLRDWLVGAVSSGVCDLCTFPLDTLKKNQQAHGGGIGAVVRDLFRDGGALRLYRGYVPRLFMVCVNGAMWNRVYVATLDALR